MGRKFAFFIDIDGTLTAERGKIPRENVLAIMQARRQGHFVFINTGRSRGNIDSELFEALQVADGIICGNGCHLIINRRDVFKESIPAELAFDVADYVALHPDLWCLMEGEHYVTVVESSPNKQVNEGRSLVTRPGQFREEHGNEPVEVIAVGPYLPDDFTQRFGFGLEMFPMSGYTDCVRKGCGKAKALGKVASMFEISHENTVAVGDSGNDLPMLESAGIAVVMGNADDSLKQIADIVTDTNLNAGVGKAILKIISDQN